MTGKAPQPSIFDGTDDVIASFFDLHGRQRLNHKSVSRALKCPVADEGSFSDLVSRLYACIESNHSRCAPSRENWRSRPVTTLADQNKSPEVLLERAVAMLSETGVMPGWLNQVPVASGLVDDRSDKRAAIDLAELQGGAARFFELKWASDTPAYAAFEILRYGLVYLFCRVNAVKFGYADLPLMQVSRVGLQVVAPRCFYDKQDLAWLQRGLDRALASFANEKLLGQLTMGFAFLAFPSKFKLPFRDGAHVRTTCETRGPSHEVQEVRDAFAGAVPVWPA